VMQWLNENDDVSMDYLHGAYERDKKDVVSTLAFCLLSRWLLDTFIHHMGRSKEQKNRQTDRQTDRNTNVHVERINTTTTTTIYKLQLNTCSTNFIKL